MFFSAWVKADPETILRHHIVDVTRAFAAFREAPARKHSPSCQWYHFNNDVPNRLTEQTRLSVCNWNPGPRRGKDGAIERHITGKWHIITLQEAIEYLEHDFLTNRLHVTHYGGCVVLFIKDTLFSDIKVTSIYLYDLWPSQPDKVIAGERGWVIRGVISWASFRRLSRNGKSFFTTMSFHINNKLCQEVRYRKEATLYNPRCDARGTCGLDSWGLQRCCLGRPCGNYGKPTSTIAEDFRLADAAWLHLVVGPKCSAR